MLFEANFEYELHNLPNKKVSGAKDHGKNYIKIKSPLVRHLLCRCLLLPAILRRSKTVSFCPKCVEM